MIGKTLEHYKITSQIGKGGMGEVYQAKDTKLGRDVAIKVLPEEFAKNADRVARFQREGQTLDDRIKSGPIPVEEALNLALQIAEALEAAHEKGVIHRDLKPANIKVTPDGKVKVLDFGLAKAFAGEQADLNLSNSPTLSVVATLQGIILGTAAYMSPEQAKGKSVDKRTDIWAFGVVLFEILAGRQLFTGETVSEILASVIKSEPDWRSLPIKLHPRILSLLERCLEKDQKVRYRDIGDARVDIQKVLADPDGEVASTGSTAAPLKNLKLILSLAVMAVILTAVISAAVIWNLRKPELPQVVRFAYDLPEGQQIELNTLSVVISPDGNTLAYKTPEGLYVRALKDWTVKLLLDKTEGAVYPFFSPDGQWIGYVSSSDGKLKKIAVSGGAPVLLCDAGSDGGLSWTSDQRIIQGSEQFIRYVSENGGSWEILFEEKGKVLGVPQLLPDGKSVLFTAGSSSSNEVMVHSLDSGESKVLFEGSFARYVKTGHIVYGFENNLYARAFNPDTLEMTGGPVPLVENVLSRTWIWQYDVSDSGTLVYIPGTMAGTDKQALVWVDREGNEELLAAPPNVYLGPRISPDGTKVALTIIEDNDDIWVWDLILESMIPVSLDQAVENNPLWIPDGERIVFFSNRGTEETSSLYWKNADGTGDAQNLDSVPARALDPVSWSGDGELLIVEEGGQQNRNIGMLSVDEHTFTPLLEGEYAEGQAEISPDGQWMAYVSSESGQREIYVRPFPDVKTKRWKISNNGGQNPLWSPDGRELFYISGDSLMAVKVKLEPTFEHEKPSSLLKVDAYSINSNLRNLHPWDIDPDGKRFLMVKPAETVGEGSAAEEPHKIRVVQNWFEELMEKVPLP
jgi:Tol biopolymer transport system component